MPFISYPTLRYYEDDSFILTSPCIYMSEEFDVTIRVPKGFQSDLASIPLIVRPLLPVVDRHANAAIVHDYLCRIQGEYKDWRGIRHYFTRVMVDEIFLIAMKESGVPWWKRTLMYMGVRAYGMTFQRF